MGNTLLHLLLPTSKIFAFVKSNEMSNKNASNQPDLQTWQFLIH
jgi:hypothetical protein